MSRHHDSGRVVALSGGVGGAKLVDGLAAVLPPGRLTAIVNTGDDFEHLGLFVCPDLDTCMYTLAGLADEGKGWGLAGESFRALERVGQLGGPTWFQLGDLDLGTHLARTAALRGGRRLTEITASFTAALGLPTTLLPMADAPRATLVETAHEGTLSFQRWLVERRGEPRVRALRYEGTSSPTPEVLAAIDAADLVVLCPSNPYVSIEPILTLVGVREALEGKKVIGVSPIVHGGAVKGPLGAMIPAIEGRPASAAAVAARYRGLLSAFVVEAGDEADVDVPTLGTQTVMRSREDRARVAQATLDFAAEVLG